MTDRELLELAAKAAGYVALTNGQAYSPEVGNFDWNPLTDDGDALRLVVKTGTVIQPKGLGVEVWVFENRVSSGVVEYGDDPYTATRRAIVRAAAEIGKEMK